jgi:allantoicase
VSEPKFVDLVDLANEAVGGAAIACNDEFFAEMENLLRPHAAVWKEHEYTDRGKWMDGWETRRYRPVDGRAPGRDSDIHDWCVVRLGLPGIIRGVVVDTAFFRGNYPDTCAIYGATIDDALDLRALATAQWTELVPRSPLQGDHKNAFEVTSTQRFTHVRLDIFPDGGVARLRVHGEVVPDWSRIEGPLDLAALEHGAVVETCSDMFFGSRNNLIKPGPSRSMADGWETRRKRGAGHEWAIIRLADAGTIEQLEIDTSHFKGNAPSLCTVEGVHAPGVPCDALEGWRPLFASPLQPHTRHRFDRELRRIGDVTHLRVSVHPCGGIARLRAWGRRAHQADAGIAALNALSGADAAAAFKRCCGSTKWSAAMTIARPFEDVAALHRIAERTWWSLTVEDHLEAFAAHPKIGEAPKMEPAGFTPAGGATPATGDATWSKGEQAGAAAASAQTLAELADANRAYEAQLGFIFIVCASGRGADDMLRDLRTRLANSREVELRTAAEEQAKITRLRLTKLALELRG